MTGQKVIDFATNVAGPPTATVPAHFRAGVAKIEHSLNDALSGIGHGKTDIGPGRKAAARNKRSTVPTAPAHDTP